MACKDGKLVSVSEDILGICPVVRRCINTIKVLIVNIMKGSCFRHLTVMFRVYKF